MRNIYRHGELILVEVKEKVKGDWREEKDYVVAHSKTGHHHMLMGLSFVMARHGKDVLVKVEKDTTLKHKKEFDAHKDLEIPAGVYKIGKKTEYDPFLKTIRQIWD